MLVLTRKVGEVIVVGDDVNIEVLEIIGDKVRIQISGHISKEMKLGIDEVYSIDCFQIMLVDIRGDEKVRLGITAPITVAIHRLEVYMRIKRENKGKKLPPDPIDPPPTCLCA
ncbi:MAG TPA: carbon storage regulator [Candidatus Paceibacterota bacterium]|nr:carbon storage regulator [Candidatus Paceibacterota bacterium]